MNHAVNQLFRFKSLLCVILLLAACQKKESPSAPVAPLPPTPANLQHQDRILLQIPAGHRYFTAVVDDAKGVRVRNLLSMAQTKDHGGNPDSGKEQTVTVSWDGLDEDGKPAPAGDYKIRGLSLPGLKAFYEYTFYNPGNPPWGGYPGSGWAGDHSQPTGIACARKGSDQKWKIAIASPGAEGGDPIFALNHDHQKVWAFKRGWDGSRSVDIADGCVWITVSGTKLMRFNMGTGQIEKFQRPAGMVSEIDLKIPPAAAASTFCLAVGPEHVAVSTDPWEKIPARIIFVEKKTGKIAGEIPSEPRSFLAYSPRGQLHVSTPKGVFTTDLTGTRTPVTLPEMATPGGIAFDAEGNLYVADMGPDQQIKVYGPDLNLIRSIGEKEGQKKSGLDYNPQALHAVEEIDVDAEGNVWAVENTHPARIGVWGKDGRLVRDFVGNAHYGGYNCALHEQDTTLVHAYSVLLRVDPKEVQSYKPWRYLNSGKKEGSPFSPWQSGPPYWFTNARLFRSDVSGKMHEYFVDTSSGWMVLYVSKNGDYRPVSAVFSNNTTGGHAPVYSRPGDPPHTFYLWTDLNADELIQDNEVQTFPQETGYKGFSGWTYLMSPDFTLYTKQHALTPSSYTEAGVPVYDMSKIRKLDVTLHNGSGAFTRVGKHLFTTDDRTNEKGDGFLGWHVFADLNGKTVARFKTQGLGVHGSMAMPVMPPGQPIGELFVSGVVKVNDEIGSVLANHGNSGQAYFYTEDGLYISHIFKDRRDNPKGKGEKVVRGADWTEVTMDQECFGGWFGRQDDGVIRYMHGHLAPQVVEIKGFDEIRKFDAGTVQIPKKTR